MMIIMTLVGDDATLMVELLCEARVLQLLALVRFVQHHLLVEVEHESYENVIL